MGEGFLSQAIFTPLFTPPLIHQGIDGGVVQLSIYIQLMPSRGRPWQNCQACTCIKELECELRRKDKALAEKAALLVLSKSSRRSCGRGADE